MWRALRPQACPLCVWRTCIEGGALYRWPAPRARVCSASRRADMRLLAVCTRLYRLFPGVQVAPDQARPRSVALLHAHARVRAACVAAAAAPTKRGRCLSLLFPTQRHLRRATVRAAARAWPRVDLTLYLTACGSALWLSPLDHDKKKKAAAEVRPRHGTAPYTLACLCARPISRPFVPSKWLVRREGLVCAKAPRWLHAARQSLTPCTGARTRVFLWRFWGAQGSKIVARMQKKNLVLTEHENRVAGGRWHNFVQRAAFGVRGCRMRPSQPRRTPHPSSRPEAELPSFALPRALACCTCPAGRATHLCTADARCCTLPVPARAVPLVRPPPNHLDGAAAQMSSTRPSCTLDGVTSGGWRTSSRP